ncbi:MAG: hypothetical protein IJ877_05030 [Candidatus Gastranaerophilales bacterium]|nr:hypothetical protein [Candidatus Gastranaerophilales bacterium]
MKINSISNINYKSKYQDYKTSKTAPKKKIDGRALLLSSLIALSSMSYMSACTAQKEETAIVQTQEYAQYKPYETINQLCEKLFKKGDKLDMDYVLNSVQEFLEENSLDNVNIEDINNPTIKEREYTLKMKTASAAFWSVPDDEMNFKEGTIYIDTNADLNDDIARYIFIDEITHELTHALQAKNDTTQQGLKGIMENQAEAEPVFWFLNVGLGNCPELLYAVDVARSGAMTKYALDNFSQEELDKAIENADKYQLLLYDKPVELDEAFAKNAIYTHIKQVAQESGIYFREKTFEDTVNLFTDIATERFLSSVPHKKEDEEKLKKALLAEITYMYKQEKEAYAAGNIALKKGFNIAENEHILADYTPLSYDLVINVLENRMNKEFN